MGVTFLGACTGRENVMGLAKPFGSETEGETSICGDMGRTGCAKRKDLRRGRGAAMQGNGNMSAGAPDMNDRHPNRRECLL
ncbi:hypothetical protein [Sagittula sp. S175]|uniref:hypothetical protein n=1 Tax=Sagittula sp. S175 TaxID=3415129 RepID=UPI003C7B69C2